MPPKIYLDTNHLIGIARARKASSDSAYSFLDDRLRQGQFGLLFYSVAALEWVDGNATVESAKEIAAVVDSAPLQYEFEIDNFVFLYEIQAELRRLEPNIRLPPIEFLSLRDFKRPYVRANEVLRDEVPSYFDSQAPAMPDTELPSENSFLTAAECVDWAFHFKAEHPDEYRERVEGHKAAYKHDVDAIGGRPGKSLKRQEIVGWMKRFVRIDRVVAGLNPGAPIDELLANVDITRCPAVDLFLKAHMKRVRAAGAVKDNDVGDWMFVPVVPYADLVLTERNLAGFLHQADHTLKAKVTHNPNRAREVLRPWLGTGR
jgi:hypothetical protein